MKQPISITVIVLALLLAAQQAGAQATGGSQPQPGSAAPSTGAGCTYQYESKVGGTMRQAHLDNGQTAAGISGTWKCVDGKMKKISN
jgi:hypothetical protein